MRPIGEVGARHHRSQETATPAGVYNLTWKSKSRRSTDNDAWLLKWYFNFINSRGVSFHEFDLPGHPASHACVRLLTRDAMWLYDWGEQWILSPGGRTIVLPGTVVVVQGLVDFSNPSPWTSIDWCRRPLTFASGGHGLQPGTSEPYPGLCYLPLTGSTFSRAASALNAARSLVRIPATLSVSTLSSALSAVRIGRALPMSLPSPLLTIDPNEASRLLTLMGKLSGSWPA
ncbi:MAG: hypothetical protein EXQ49_08330 [Acidobacteria bacterium]|nr:hypothetical protein [Acidobacteriota bacterium]